MSNADYRIKVAFLRHLKTKKLKQQLGAEGVLALMALWSYAAEFRPDGDLSGLSSEDLELTIDWMGDKPLIETLSKIGFLDGQEGEYSLHDWQEHNPWVAETEERSDAARLSRLFRKNPDAAKAFKEQGRTGINAEEYRTYALGTPVQRPHNDRTAVPTTPAPAPALKEEPQEESAAFAPLAAALPDDPPIADPEPEPEPEPKASRAPAKATKVSKGLIPADWQPAESTYGILDGLGIDRSFAARCVPEFVLYWTERGDRRPGWEASFVNSVKRTWERRPPPSVPGSDGLTPVGVGSDRLKGRTVVEEIMARHRRFEEIHGPYVPEDGFDPFAASLRPAQPALSRPEPRLLEGEYAH